jgi:DNA-directed RNA polymerase specialized sigma subunit
MTTTLQRPTRFHGDLLVGSDAQAQLLLPLWHRPTPPRRHKPKRGINRAVQLVLAFPPPPRVLRRRRQRPRHCHSAANELAMQHLDIADKVAANLSRRTGHPIEDLRQIAMMGIIEASRRYSPERGPFRPYARTYANGEVYHFLRDKGFLIKVPASWRELHARGLKLMRLGVEAAEVPERLGVSVERWREIVEACSQRVVAMEVVECSEVE